MPNLVRPIVEGKNRRVFRAYLAEEYDGIGQFVAVSLARSGVTSGFKAKISLGDVGNDVHYPVGTPVLVFSDHGLLEILSFGGPDPGLDKSCTKIPIQSTIYAGSFVNTGSPTDGDYDRTKYTAMVTPTLGVDSWTFDLGSVKLIQTLRIVSTDAHPFFVPLGDPYTTSWLGYFQFDFGKTLDAMNSHGWSGPFGQPTDAFLQLGFSPGDNPGIGPPSYLGGGPEARYVRVRRNLYNDGSARFELVEFELSSCLFSDWIQDLKGYAWNAFT